MREVGEVFKMRLTNWVRSRISKVWKKRETRNGEKNRELRRLCVLGRAW